MQHRGGPPGFLKVVDAHTLALADCAGNHQLISVGNASGNDRVALILVDYAHKVRLKVLGRLSGLFQAPLGQFVAINGEGGHVTLAANDAEEARLIDALRHRFGHVSVERVLSGPGLVNLYEAIAGLDGAPVLPLAPADVVERARSGSDAQCSRALRHFCELLGSVAGNLALTLGARGGVYLAGGIAPRIFDELESSAFRQRFEGKGRFSGYLAQIPTFVIASEVSPALLGASRALDPD